MLLDRLKPDKVQIPPPIDPINGQKVLQAGFPTWKIAHKFALSDDFIKLAESFLFPDMSREYADYSPIPKLTEIARLPYPFIWIEYPEYYKYEKLGITGLFIATTGAGYWQVTQIIEWHGKQILINLFEYDPANLWVEGNVLKFEGRTLLNSAKNGNAIAPVIGQITTILALINSPTTYDRAEITHSESVNARRVRKGKSFLHDYSILEIKKEIRQVISATGDTHESRRLHWRRGHFKQRKTGLFWWNPHLAGNKELGFHEKDYAV